MNIFRDLEAQLQGDLELSLSKTVFFVRCPGCGNEETCPEELLVPLCPKCMKQFMKYFWPPILYNGGFI